MSEFLSSPFSPAMPMGNTTLAAGENTSLTLERKLFKASPEKISALQETVSLLNTSLGEDNQGRLETDEELKILGKNLEE